jgi:hypothetical protein
VLRRGWGTGKRALTLMLECRSDMHKHMALGNLAGRRDTEKLDKEVFSGAPVEAMQHALVFLKCVFASLH